MKFLLLCVVFVAFSSVSARKKCFYLDELPEKYEKGEKGERPEKEEKPKLECLEEHEAFFSCSQLCDDLTCENPEPAYCKRKCTPRCLCEEGYVRNGNNACVKLEECPVAPTCGSNEHYEECGTPKSCEPSCQGTQYDCAEMCVTGCYCDKGFVRNDEGDCVVPEECPELECGENENFVLCSTLCGEATCDHGDFFCGAGCSNKCHCNDGFVRDAENKCIKKEECPGEQPNPQIGCLDPIKSGPCKAAFPRFAYDSESKSCIPFSYGGCEPNGNNYESLDECQNSCSSYVENIIPICPANEHYEDCGMACVAKCNEETPTFCTANCVVGCFCDGGYVRNGDGGCVLPEECPAIQPICKANEDYTDCGAHPACNPTCDKPTGPYRCPRICMGGCICKQGYVKDTSGNCVTVDACPTEEPNPQIGCLDPIKVGPCKAAFPRFAYDSESKSCIQFSYGGCEQNSNNYESLDECQKSCSNYVENIKPICRAHELYSDCGAYASCQKTCDNPEGPNICPAICAPGCVCDEGYVLDSEKKICVLVEECPKPILTCKTNEEYLDCGPNCDATCADPTGKYCDIQYVRCPDGCYCKSGYARDDEGVCVKIEECPAKTLECVIEHEAFFSCSNYCEDLTCENPKPTYCKRMCMPRCLCEEGYVRNQDNACVKFEECPAIQICPANEHYEDCGTACVAKCNEEPAKFCTANCVVGCFCDGGYVRNGDGGCVMPKDCPAIQPICKANEDYTDCGTPCPLTCENYKTPFACPAVCDAPGCFCKQGYVKDSNGNCIKPEECPTEEPNPQIGCLDPIKQGRCKAAFPRFAYDSKSKSCIQFTYGGCGQNSNNYESLDECQNSCSSYVENIKPICAANEEYLDCGPNCDANCADPTGENCNIVHIRCPDGCFCKSGYARDNQGVCVKIEECPAIQPICKKSFESYTDCGTACPKTCDNIGDTNMFCTLQCVQGCFCEEGYVRNAQGDCVVVEECPQPICKKSNQEYKCGTVCPKTCENYDQVISCTKQCVFGCHCENGYVLNENQECILPEQCPAKPLECVVEHEAFFSCSQYCEDLTCENPEPTYCRRQCLPRCLCEEGYLRNKNNQCVKPSNCPKDPKESKSCEKAEKSKSNERPERPNKPREKPEKEKPQPKNSKSCSQEKRKRASNSNKKIKAKSEKSCSDKRDDSKSNHRAKPVGGKSCSGGKDGKAKAKKESNKSCSADRKGKNAKNGGNAKKH